MHIGIFSYNYFSFSYLYLFIYLSICLFTSDLLLFWFLVCFFVCLFQHKVSLCNSGCLRIHSGDQTGLKVIYLPASATAVIKGMHHQHLAMFYYYYYWVLSFVYAYFVIFTIFMFEIPLNFKHFPLCFYYCFLLSYRNSVCPNCNNMVVSCTFIFVNFICSLFSEIFIHNYTHIRSTLLPHSLSFPSIPIKPPHCPTLHPTQILFLDCSVTSLV